MYPAKPQPNVPCFVKPFPPPCPHLDLDFSSKVLIRSLSPCDGSLDWDGSNGKWKKWTEKWYILEAESTRLAEG